MKRNEAMQTFHSVLVNDSQFHVVANTMSSCQDVSLANQNASARVGHNSAVVITQVGHPRPSTFHQKQNSWKTLESIHVHLRLFLSLSPSPNYLRSVKSECTFRSFETADDAWANHWIGVLAALSWQDRRQLWVSAQKVRQWLLLAMNSIEFVVRENYAFGFCYLNTPFIAWVFHSSQLEI